MTSTKPVAPFRWLFLWLIVGCIVSTPAIGSIDTVRKDNGTAAATPALNDGWEESVILPLTEPCIVRKVLIYYTSGTGTDVVRITGDASEGTIPPTQYCFSYNTLAEADVKVTGKGWVEVDFSAHNVMLDGTDRIVIQHVVRSGGPLWGQDNNGQSPITSFQYDPVTQNPNFLNIPGIYYQARGDYMVRVVVDRPFDMRPAATMIDVTAAVGLLGADGKPLRSDQVSVVDWNGDGYDDVCVAGRFFQNDSGRGFRAVSLPLPGAPSAWGDVDNDGDADVFITQGFGNDQLWRNDGKGLFSNVTADSKIINNAPTVTALWLDIEQDGDLDLFIANGRSTVNGSEVYYQDKLWRNDGGMVFTDVTVPSKLALGEPAPYYDTWGASLCDYNSDGRTDIFVATYRLAPDRLYRNNGDGTFTEVSSATGAIGIPTTQPQYFGHGMGSEWGDVNGDGLVDLLVGNLGHPDSRAQYSNPSLVLRNTATASSPRFTNWYDVSSSGVLDWHGIKFKEMNAGLCMADMDHDGSLDVWHGQISYESFGAGANRPSHLYLGSTDPTKPFRDVTWQSGMFIHGAWTAARGDFDRDGDLDLLCASGTESVKLFRNDLPKNGASVTVRLRDTRAGKHLSGYGARMVVAAGQKRYHRWLPGTVSGGRMSQMTQDLHVGLSAAATVDSITVYWPGGVVTKHTGIAPHSYVELVSDGTSRLIMPLRPVNLRPARGSVGVASTDDFVWATSSASPVRLEITPRSTPSSPVIIRENLTGWRATIDLPPGLYDWKVVSASGESDIWSLHVGDPVPALPRVLQPALSDTSVPTATVLRWSSSTYSIPGAFTTSYRVRLWSMATKTPLMVVDTVVSDTSLTLPTLTASTQFFGSIRASYRSAMTSDSALVSFRTYGVPPSPLAVFPADGATGVTTRPRFQWTRPAAVDKGYEIEVDSLASFGTSTVRKAGDTSLAWTPPLKAGRTYYWRARGLNLAGTGQWSTAAMFTTAGTTGVHENFGEGPCTGRTDVYDLTGRLLWSSADVSVTGVPLELSGLVLVVTRNAAGHVCSSQLQLR